MFGKRFDRQRAGRVISARTLNRPIAEAERLSKLSVAAPLAMYDGPNGICIYLARVEPFWAKITGAPDGSGGYPWLEQWTTSGGNWTDGTLSTASGAPKAYNSFGTSAPTVAVGTIVLLRWSNSNDLRFTISSC